MHDLCASGEEYLKWIYRIENKIGSVRSIDLAIFMGYSRASVSAAVKKLEQRQLLYKDKQGILHLSKEGYDIAKGFDDRHQLLTDVFIEMGVDPIVALQDACKLEHVLSEVTWTQLKHYIQERRESHG